VSVSPRVLVTVVLVSAGAVACANMGEPPGGPEDSAPLAIQGSVPEPEQAAVASNEPVTIRFAEPPDHRSVMRALHVMPPAGFRETIWTDSSLTLVPDTAWAADRSTIVWIGRSARDRRGNELERPFRLRFTTKAVADSGAIAGTAWPGREVGASHVLVVAAYPAEADASPDPEEAWPAALDDAPRDGRYRLTGLDTARAWLVVGVANRDDDPRPGASGEVWGAAPSLVVFGEKPEVEAPDFLVGTLDSLGTIVGQVTADSGAVAVVVAEGGDVREIDVQEGGGSFELSVPTGREYRLGAFLDVDGDSSRGGEEPGIDLEKPVDLRWTARRDGILFDLKAPDAAADSADVGRNAPGGDE
jgi:hypothetical protein